MMKFLDRQGVLLKHFDRYVKTHTDRVVQNAKELCAEQQRPYRYFYFLDPDFGFIHVRLASCFPFTVQVYVNGHQRTS